MKKDDKQKKQNDDQNLEGTVTLAEFEALQTELQTVQEQFEQVSSQFKRALADYHNLEKRVAEGRSEMVSWAATQLIEKLLPSLDYLELAITGAGEEEKKSGWFRGVELAIRQLEEVLRSEGLEQIGADPSTSLGTGSEFDPAIHEAVDTRVGEDGKVLEVMRKGYKLNNRVLRPAQVVVGRKES